jgi:hypothetical protein
MGFLNQVTLIAMSLRYFKDILNWWARKWLIAESKNLAEKLQFSTPNQSNFS